jgi:hypothetical protein
MPAEVQKAVVGALTTESDPAKLQGFATAIQAQYPVAAGLLMAKAQALMLVHPVTPNVPQPTPVRPTPSPTPDPVPTSGTYTVKSGDYPIRIAQKIVHDSSRWRELVAANPNKKRAADGNFASLVPGEVLKLPASWTDTPPLIDSKAPHPALPAPGGTRATHP